MLWTLIAVPLLAGGGLLVGGRRADRIAAPVALVTALAVLVLALVRGPAVEASFVAGVSFGLAAGGLSTVMCVLVAVVLAAVTVFATGEPELRRARFFGLLLVFAGAMLVTVTATTLLSLLMAWEVMGAASYALIGYRWREPRRGESGTVAFLTTRAADLGLYLAAGAALAGGAGGLSLDALAGLPDGWRDAVAAGVVLAALGKSAQLPFSFWLSRAMDGPSPVSALLHSATMVAAGGYLLLRLEPLLAATPWAGAVAAVAGALTAVLLGAVAVVQHDLKQLLAASTCAQLGFVVLAAGTGGVAGGGGQLVAHALAKSLLFLGAGAWLTALGTKELAGLRGAGRVYPVVGVSFAAGGLVLAGTPPLALWVTKDHVLAGALGDSVWLYVLGLAAAGLSAAYAARAVAIVWSRPDVALAGRVSGWQAGALVPLAAGAVALGVLVVPGVWAWFAGIVGGGDPAGPAWWEAVASGAVAVGVAGVVAAVTVRRDPVGQPADGRHELDRTDDWLGLERFVRTAVVTPGLAGAGALARFDDQVIDRGVAAGAAVGTAFARVTDRRVEWSVDGLVRAVASGAGRLGRLARRPQTGQLHQYYAQAVVALAALAVLLIVLSNGR
ncbi:NADH dehydrogenase [Actinophytocola xinjiangensis]|uniref:NADH dehydrogenase n=1 Tax=Actinophytocola xinjiangensis TaxID=485602 RepID=A0A7Z1AY77_9PSEU|nr:proton-conducting transporter membrane subunit [Actinophytocola xinjiangensis]OLF10175.1 NADH dehydrogenase [Actinophytocola xinjiangensis]